MKRLSLLLGALALVLLVGCQETSEVSPGELGKLEPAAQTQVLGPLPFVLPAHKLPGDEHIPGKADEFSDYRNAHPQWYAITEIPAGEYRPMNEWEPMQSVMLTFSNYMPGDAATFQTFSDIIVNSVGVVDVWIVVDSDTALNALAAKLLEDGLTQADIDDGIEFFRWENDAIWIIDFGPLPIVNEDDTVAFMDFRYYHQRVLDDAIPTRLGNAVGVNTYRSPLNLEGGNFQADGEEYCYTTERELYYTGLSAQELTDVFIEWFGCEKVAILKDITDDGTGHIDMLFKLADKHKAILGEYTVVNDPTNKQRMDDNEDILEALVFDDGGQMVVHRLPFPNKYGGTPRTYLNSTMMNDGAGTKVNLWPMYTVDKDIEAQAEAVWLEAMPDWTHVGIVSDQISLYSGAIHCITRTVPDLPLQKWIADGACVGGMCVGGAGAYADACIPDSEPTPGCWGPAWQCPCNECVDGECVEDSCGGINYDGCCDGNVLQYCDEGQLAGGDCGDGGCGWDPNNEWYDCTFQGEDPSGAKPRDCSEYTGGEPNPCAGKECGPDGQGGTCGECEHGFECAGGLCEEKTGPECGDGVCDEGEDCDSCATDCACAEGSECVNGQCLAPCDDECADGEVGCEGILPWTCVLPPDSMCLIKSYAAACEDGFVCDDATGTCVEEGTGPEEDATIGPDEDTIGPDEDTIGPGEDTTGGDDGGGGGGSNCTTTGASSPMAGGLVLMALLGLAVTRRRVIA